MEKDDTDFQQLQDASVQDPDNAQLRYLLGAQLAQDQQYDRAVLEMSAALTLDPGLHTARFQLGLLLLTLGQPQRALQVLSPLEQLGEDTALKHFKRGLEALIADDFGNAQRHLHAGMEFDASEPLRRDMNLLVERIQAAQLASGNYVKTDAESDVRTDFSAYGLTKH
jgi:tetratricopeptide (TPR) repeat protein